MSPEVLLVESSLNIAGFVTYALRKAIPATVVEYVNNASRALDYLFYTGDYASRSPDLHPDLILLSMTLPYDDSHEILHIIKSYIRTRAIPVVRLIDPSMEPTALNQYPINSNSYISKSENRTEFMRQIVRVGAYWLNMTRSPHSEPSEDTSDLAASGH